MKNVLVVLSGGQDSTTCLWWAKKNASGEVHALTFNYGQRHAIELQSAARVARMAGVDSHEVIRLDSVECAIHFDAADVDGPNRVHNNILESTSPIVDHARPVGHYGKAEEMPGGVEPTFVPGRNILFLAIAANRAVARDCDTIVIGVSQEDYGGYPDCREGFIICMTTALQLGLFGCVGNSLRIRAPLLHLSKREVVLMAYAMDGCMEALAFSHSCYDGEYPPNPLNHASILRARGFFEAAMPDPLIVRAKRAKLLPPDYPADGYLEGHGYNLAERDRGLHE